MGNSCRGGEDPGEQPGMQPRMIGSTLSKSTSGSGSFRFGDFYGQKSSKDKDMRIATLDLVDEFHSTNKKNRQRGVNQRPCKLVILSTRCSLENLGRFARCKQETRTGDTVVVGIIPGNFLTPSILNSLDKGKGVISCLNLGGVDYVCFGQYEGNLTAPNLKMRIEESKFTWLNSNLKMEHISPGLTKPYAIIEITAGSHTRRVAFMGFMDDDETMYLPGSQVKDSKSIRSSTDAARELWDIMSKKEKAKGGIDAVIPITNQSFDKDLKLGSIRAAKHMPLILGCHESGICDLSSPRDSRIIRIGAEEYDKVVKCCLLWPSAESKAPTVTVEVKSLSLWKHDPVVAYAVNRSAELLLALGLTPADISMSDVLSREVSFSSPSHKSSSGKSTGSTRDPVAVGAGGGVMFESSPHFPVSSIICSALRSELRSDVAILSDGVFSLESEDKDTHKRWKYAALLEKLPEPVQVMVLTLPGAVLSDCIACSREVGGGAYLHLDNEVVWDAESKSIATIRKQAFDRETNYSVVVDETFLKSDRISPFVDYMWTLQQNNEDNIQVERLNELGKDLVQVVVAHFAPAVLEDFCSNKFMLGEAYDRSPVKSVRSRSYRSALKKYSEDKVEQVFLQALIALTDDDSVDNDFDNDDSDNDDDKEKEKEKKDDDDEEREEDEDRLIDDSTKKKIIFMNADLSIILDSSKSRDHCEEDNKYEELSDEDGQKI